MVEFALNKDKPVDSVLGGVVADLVDINAALCAVVPRIAERDLAGAHDLSYSIERVLRAIEEVRCVQLRWAQDSAAREHLCGK